MRVVLTGGGTGGHVYPALAIAEALRRAKPDVDLHFIGTASGFEARALASAGEKLHTISAGGIISKGMIARIAGLSKAARGAWQSSCLLRDLKPDVIVGTGGFVMAPVLLAASFHGVPYVLQEQNSFPGYSTRKFARRARVVCLGSEAAAQFLPNSKTLFTGNPIRAALVRAATTQRTARTSGAKVRLLIVGGSLGARSINQAVANCLNELTESLVVEWQYGRNGVPESLSSDVVSRLADEGRLDAQPFFDDMDQRYSRADLVLCRAGALTLAELALFGLPAVLVPFPFAAHQHQLSNAREVERAGAAHVLQDHELTGEALLSTTRKLLSGDDKLQEMSAAMKSLAKPRAAQDIAEYVMTVANS